MATDSDEEDIADATLSELSRYLHHEAVCQMGRELMDLPEAEVHNLSQHYGPENANYHILIRWKHKHNPSPADVQNLLELAWRRKIKISDDAFRCIGMQHPGKHDIHF